MSTGSKEKRGRWADTKSPEEISAIMSERAKAKWRKAKYKSRAYRTAHAKVMVKARDSK